MKKLLLWSTLILTIALFLEEGLFYDAGFHIPERVPLANTFINVPGAFLWITFITLQVILIKKIRKFDPASNWGKLIGFGTVPVSIAEAVHQLVYWWGQEDFFTEYLKHWAECTVLGLSIAFCITFQLKTSKPLWFILIIPGLAVLLALMTGVSLEPLRDVFKQGFHQNNF